MRRSARVAVASADANLWAAALRHGGPHGGLSIARATGTGRRRASAGGDEADADVLLLDLAGAGVDHDPLRVLASAGSRHGQRVVLRRGSPETHQYEWEAFATGVVDGSLPCDVPPAMAAEALIEVARGGDPRVLCREPVLPAAAAIHRLFRESDLAAGVSAAIVGTNAMTWQEIAAATGFSVRTVQASPKRLAPTIRADRDCAHFTEITQPVLFYWAGRHGAYIQSWCHRHGHRRGRGTSGGPAD